MPQPVRRQSSDQYQKEEQKPKNQKRKKEVNPKRPPAVQMWQLEWGAQPMPLTQALWLLRRATGVQGTRTSSMITWNYRGNNLRQAGLPPRKCENPWKRLHAGEQNRNAAFSLRKQWRPADRVKSRIGVQRPAARFCRLLVVVVCLLFALI